MPGVVKVVIEGDFAGVIATSRARAYRALEAMTLEWSPGEEVGDADIARLTTVEDGKGVVVQQRGRARAGLRRGSLVQADYRTPLAAHAHLEPQAAMVDVRSERVIARVSTQSPDAVRDGLAKLLKRPKEAIELTASYLGGGFGRRLQVRAAFEAARLSRAAGRPVHVGWNRSEEFRHGAFRPPTHSLLRASLDGEGRIIAMEHQLASGDVAFSLLPNVVAVVMGADFGAWRGGVIPYDIPHRLVRSQRVRLPVPTTWWRGLGLMANTFAIESFMDELAQRAGSDPLDFRLLHLQGDEQFKRLARVLSAVAEASGWKRPLPAGRARGLACCLDFGTVVAQVAEVSVAADGIRVHRVTAAVDPGLVINPDGAIAQIHGAVIMGLSSTLHERITVKDGLIEAANFDRYPLLGMREAPEIEVVLLESGEQPSGLGEPPIGPIAAAVANAVFALTGRRLRELPLDLS